MTERTEEQIVKARHDAHVATKVVERITDFHGQDCGWSSPKCWTTTVKKFVELSESCDKLGCGLPATTRIAINVHGCVYEHDVCDTHKTAHGTWRDCL